MLPDEGEMMLAERLARAIVFEKSSAAFGRNALTGCNAIYIFSNQLKKNHRTCAKLSMCTLRFYHKHTYIAVQVQVDSFEQKSFCFEPDFFRNLSVQGSRNMGNIRNFVRAGSAHISLYLQVHWFDLWPDKKNCETQYIKNCCRCYRKQPADVILSAYSRCFWCKLYQCLPFDMN